MGASIFTGYGILEEYVWRLERIKRETMNVGELVTYEGFVQYCSPGFPRSPLPFVIRQTADERNGLGAYAGKIHYAANDLAYRIRGDFSPAEVRFDELCTVPDLMLGRAPRVDKRFIGKHRGEGRYEGTFSQSAKRIAGLVFPMETGSFLMQQIRL